MDKEIDNSEEVNSHIKKWCKKIIEKPIEYVDKINVNCIMSVKQRLKKETSQFT